MTDTKVDFFFVYGTLKEGGYFASAFDEIRVSSEKAILTGYNLFDLGAFPAIKAGTGSVRGEVHRYKDQKKATELMDHIEGYNKNNEKDSLYLRRAVEVVTESGEIVSAYTYVLNRDVPKHVKTVESGSWNTK